MSNTKINEKSDEERNAFLEDCVDEMLNLIVSLIQKSSFKEEEHSNLERNILINFVGNMLIKCSPEPVSKSFDLNVVLFIRDFTEYVEYSMGVLAKDNK